MREWRVNELTEEESFIHIESTLVTADNTPNGHIVIDANKDLLARPNQVQFVPLSIIDAGHIKGQFVVATSQVDVDVQMATTQANAEVILGHA